MEVLKSGKTIVGAHFTVAEKKAIEIEARKAAWQCIDDAILEINAAVLWRLHNSFGWGPVRLKRFYDNFKLDTKTLMDHYELSPDDSGWINIEMLKEYGIDIHEWAKECPNGGLE